VLLEAFADVAKAAEAAVAEEATAMLDNKTKINLNILITGVVFLVTGWGNVIIYTWGIIRGFGIWD
jgi:hypothetical protein